MTARGPHAGILRFSFAPASTLFVLAAALVLQAADSRPAAAEERLSLSDAVRIASSASASVQIAKTNEAAARARRAQARGVLLPTFTGTASDFNRTVSLKAQGFAFPATPGFPKFPDPLGPFESFDARIRASQTLIDLAGWTHLRAADLNQHQATADRNASAEAAAQQAATAYVRALRASALVGARRADERIAADLLSLADAAQQAGTAPKIDRTRARTQLAAARGQTLVAQNQLDRALVDLARALGHSPDERIVLVDTLGADVARSDAPEVAATATGVAYDRRPELASQQAREASARVERSAISAERLPRIEAQGDWGLSGQNAAHAVDTREYGVALTMPVFDGGRREGRIAEQTSVIEASAIRTRDLRDQIAAEVQAALLDLSSAREQLAVADEQLGLAQEQLDEARERFTSGVAGNVEVINAQASLVGARDTEIEARFAIASARVALARATGVARTLR